LELWLLLRGNRGFAGLQARLRRTSKMRSGLHKKRGGSALAVWRRCPSTPFVFGTSHRDSRRMRLTGIRSAGWSDEPVGEATDAGGLA